MSDKELSEDEELLLACKGRHPDSDVFDSIADNHDVLDVYRTIIRAFRAGRRLSAGPAVAAQAQAHGALLENMACARAVDEVAGDSRTISLALAVILARRQP